MKTLLIQIFIYVGNGVEDTGSQIHRTHSGRQPFHYFVGLKSKDLLVYLDLVECKPTALETFGQYVILGDRFEDSR